MDGIKSRKKITKACDNCKKRKLKCSGELPCLLCKQRKLECQYIRIDKRTLKGQRKGIKKNVGESEISMSLIENSSSVNHRIKQPSINDPNPNTNSLPSQSPIYLYNGNTLPKIVTIKEPNSLLNNEVKPNQSVPLAVPKYLNNLGMGTGYVPRNLEPLLSFPIQDENTNKGSKNTQTNISNENNFLDNNEDEDGLSNENGRNTRLLSDSGGNLRYIGESSPLSLLFECRNIFYENLGHTAFTDDPCRMSIVDEPGKHISGIPIQLPTRAECDTLVKVFEENINQSFYIFEMVHFKKEVVSHIYQNPIRASNHKLALLHLVLALGSLFAELSPDYSFKELGYNDSTAYFESGYTLMNYANNNSGLWMSEAYFLIYFYYQSTSKRSTSWLTLNMAIKNAQALGLHRKYINESFKDMSYVLHRRKLWQSLYICDRISSILLGRPLTIGDYDCDDFHSTMVQGPIRSDEDFTAVCQVETAKIAIINGKIVKNFYGDGIINTSRARKLAIELRKWSMNLRPEVQIDKLLNSENHLKKELCFPLLLVHISQLYGIVLLSRPFFMYYSFNKSTGHKKLGEQNLLVNFRNACIKAAILTIKFIDFFIKKCPKRMELFTTINCCFNAALILGLQIVYEKKNEINGNNTEYTVSILMLILDLAKNTLSNYGSMSSTSQRFSNIVKSIHDSLNDKFSISPYDEPNTTQTPVKMPNRFVGIGNDNSNKSFLSFNNSPRFNVAPELDNLLNFQQFFLPPDSTSPSNTDVSEKHNTLDLFMHNLGKSDILFDSGI